MNSTTLSRRGFLRAMGLGAAALAIPRWTSAQAKGAKPNILFILVDDLGKEWLSCYGSEDMETPNLDTLASGGIRFENAYSMPQCTPTRVTLLTGQYPHRHGWVNHWDVPRWGAGCHFDWNHNASFARIMKSAGYATAAAGKWQINDFRVQPKAMEHHGFDDWCMWTGYETDNPPSAERYWNPYINTREGSKTYDGRFGADVFTDFLIDFMKRNKGQPMMMYFAMALTHTPFTHTPFTTTPLDPDAEGDVAKHKAMVRYVDHTVARLVKALEEQGLRDNTVVIFTTDNGTTGKMNARLNGRVVRGGKAQISEPGVCAPFIVNGPGLVPQGVVSDALTDFSDMLPTFAELGGAELPKDIVVDGHSIAPVILGKAQGGPRDWILAMGAHPAKLTEEGVVPAQPLANRAIREKRFKLWVEDGKPSRLYDLQDDPGETKNLITSSVPEVKAARDRLIAVFRACPEKDARPRYTPTPPQPWDKKM